MAKKKGKGGPVAVGAAALLLLLGGGVGIGRGQGMLPSEGESAKPQTQQEQTEQAPPEPTDDGVLTVRVAEDIIYFEDEPVSVSELEEELLAAYTEGTPVELVDDMGIKAQYDEAAAVLDKLNIEYETR